MARTSALLKVSALFALCLLVSRTNVSTFTSPPKVAASPNDEDGSAAASATSRRSLCAGPALATLLSGDRCIAAPMPTAADYLSTLPGFKKYLENPLKNELLQPWERKGILVDSLPDQPSRFRFSKGKDDFLQEPPQIRYIPTWGRCTLVMIDPDAPNGPSADGKKPGEKSPILHWLDTDSISSPGFNGATQEVIYAGPAPPAGTHRYITVIFKQRGDVQMLGTEKERVNWDFPKFLELNKDVLEPVASSYYYCSSV